METPWGRSDSQSKIAVGVSWVGTPSHGGLVVSSQQGRAKLSEKAIKLAAIEWQSAVFFEEDCAYAVAFFEVPEWCRKLWELEAYDWLKYLEPGFYDHYGLKKQAPERAFNLFIKSRQSDEQIRAEYRPIIERYYPAYFSGAECTKRDERGTFGLSCLLRDVREADRCEGCKATAEAVPGAAR